MAGQIPTVAFPVSAVALIFVVAALRMTLRGGRSGVITFADSGVDHRRSTVPLKTRQRRRLTTMVVLATIVCFTVGGAFALGSGVGASYGTTFVSAKIYTVQPGDTVWSIAHDIAPGNDVRRVVDAIVEMNDVASGALRPGTVLDLPDG